MSGHPRVWLLQTPSFAAPAWREALAAACSERGWDFAVQEKGESPPVPAADRPMLTIAWLHHVGDHPVTHFLVQHGSPEEAEDVLEEQGELSRHDRLQDASLRLAVADFLVGSGVARAGTNDPVLHIPGLGDVARPAGAPDSSLYGRTPHPLSLYRQTPSPEGAETFWGPELFVYPAVESVTTEAATLALIGRRRLLFNGPNIHLAAGRWQFRAEFSVEPGAGADLLIEWGFGYEVQSLPVLISAAGRYEVELVQTWPEFRAADFRISLMTPSLDGRLEFHGGTVTRLVEALEPAPTDQSAS